MYLNYFSRTITPILRADPAIIFFACSMSFAFKSGILILAISSISAMVILPTLSTFGLEEPLEILIFFLISSLAGAVFISKLNVLSIYTVIITGTVSPFLEAVAALNCLQNSIRLTWCWPRLLPTGGAGVAAPPGICNLIFAFIAFAIV